MANEMTALTTMSTTRTSSNGATGNLRSRSTDRLDEGMTVPSWCEDLDARSERHSAVHGGLRTSDHPRSALPRITPSGFADVVTVTAAQQSRIHTGFLRPHQGRTIQTHGGYQGPPFHAAQPRQHTGPHNRIGSDHELWGEKLHGNREVPTSDRLRAKLHRDANFA